MDAIRFPDRLSFEEYLEFEESTETRHELVGGVVYAMGGASDWHNIVSGNLFNHAFNRLRGGSCRAFMNEMKLRVSVDAADDGYYPDVMVCCDPQDSARLFRTSPVFIAEIASPSTGRIDRNEKFDAYCTLDSVQEYSLIQSATPRVELFRRDNDWAVEFFRLDDTVEFASIGLKVPVRELYDGVDYLR